jgi:hypothetical protein
MHRSPGAPATTDLRAFVQDALWSSSGIRSRVIRMGRRTAAYRTSSAMEELDVRLDDGRRLSVLFKDVSPRALVGDAREVKPAFLQDPRREIETYRAILVPNGLTVPGFYGAVVDEALDRYWLFLEFVPAWRLFSFEEPLWREAACWLADMHARFQQAPGLLDLAGTAHLLRYDGNFFRLWPRRALAFARWDSEAAPTGRRQAFEQLVRRYDEVIERLVALPPTFVHGEFFASNVLVRGGRAICPVDWEMAAVGPGLVDLAALTAGGWTAQQREALALAYRAALPDAAGPAADTGDFLAVLDACRLHLALQWLGWSPTWTPPPDETHDWADTALSLAESLGLL